LNVIHEFGKKGIRDRVQLLNSKEKIDVLRIGKLLLQGLGLEQVHRILSMDSEK